MNVADAHLSVVAVVLTYDRPSLAESVVKGLLDVERFPESQVVLVINGTGGLHDPSLEKRVRVLRLPENLGPAGGFAAGMQLFLEEYDEPWLYVCEDDVGLFDLPTPRVARLVDSVSQWAVEHPSQPVGGVVAYGRRLNRWTGITTPHYVRSAQGFEEVDVAPWGGSLLSREVLEAGALPNTDWFFGFEDFDFWLQVHEAGYVVLLDREAAIDATRRAFGAGREAALEGRRPRDREEPWRRYYEARNFFYLAKRHGRWSWYLTHLAKSVRRWQLSGPAGRRALWRGLVDGLLRRSGREGRYVRTVGEFGQGRLGQ